MTERKITDPFYWNGFLAYRTYLAIQLHFNSPKYDYFRYGGNVKATEDSFLKRNDRYWFAKFARDKTKEEIEEHLVAFFKEHGNSWIGNLNSDDANRAYMTWQRQFQNFSYTFGNDLELVFEKAKTISDPFRPESGRVPEIISLLQSGQIQEVTVVSLDCLFGFMNRIDPLIDDPYVWRRYKDRYDKTKPFYLRKLDQERIRKIVQTKIGHLAKNG